MTAAGPRVHLLVVGLCAALLLSGCLLETDGEQVFAAGLAIPSVCVLRSSPLGSCPGCGLSRSVVLLCRLELSQSLALHPAGVVLVMLALLELPYRLARMRGKAGTAVVRWATVIERLLLVTAVVVSVVGWLWRCFFEGP